MIFTNDKAYGGSFKTQFLARLKTANRLTVATGYFGANLIEEIQPKLIEVSQRGRCRILLGMAFHAGVTSRQKNCIDQLDLKLRDANSESGIYISRKDYHGKIYQVDNEIYLGSSNFSKEGFETRWECTARINDRPTSKVTEAYLDYLFSQPTTARLSEVALGPITPTKPKTHLRNYRISKIPSLPVVGQMDIKLRVDEQPASSLNLFFDKGRKNKFGLYAPRPWYEVEITTEKQDYTNPVYPPSVPLATDGKSRNGTFIVYIIDGKAIYKLEMKVASDNGKAIMTSEASGGRKTLGEYMKGRLEATGVLKRGERITSETLEAYGRDTVTLKKLSNTEYIFEF
jgi:NgoFVII restriction endonuclease